LVARRRLTIRDIRRRHFSGVLAGSPRELFSNEFFEKIISEKRDQDRVFWKVGVVYFSLIALLGFALAPFKLQISILGFSSGDLYSLREVVLFLCAVMSSYLFLIQSFSYQLEDLLRVFIESRTQDEIARRFYSVRYQNPITALTTAYFAPPNNHSATAVARAIFKIFDCSRILVVAAFALVMMGIPLFAAGSILIHATHSPLVSMFVVGIWMASAILNVAHTVIANWGVPFKDYSYVMKLAEIQGRDPERHRLIHEEIIRTKQLRDLG